MFFFSFSFGSQFFLNKNSKSSLSCWNITYFQKKNALNLTFEIIFLFKIQIKKCLDYADQILKIIKSFLSFENNKKKIKDKKKSKKIHLYFLW